MKFDYHKYSDEHNMFMRDLRSIPIPGSTGGMTSFPGIFIYSVARILNASRILEVGTRNGISAATFCRAMHKNRVPGTLISCDVRDVEAGKAVPGAGAEPFPLVPSKMIAKIGDGSISTHFLHKKGADVLRLVPAGSLDVILLDGSHKEDDVYEEIPLALAALRDNGVLLMDDVYPDELPLQYHAKVIPGVWRGLKRLIDDGIIEGFEVPEEGYSVAYIEK